MNDATPKVYLSRRNLTVLLSKLDREAAGENTECSIIKNRSPSAAYRQSMKSIMVIAVDDEEYYCSQARAAGAAHATDEQKLHTPSTGINVGTIW